MDLKKPTGNDQTNEGIKIVKKNETSKKISRRRKNKTFSF
jgi:hypothetical protein